MSIEKATAKRICIRCNEEKFVLLDFPLRGDTRICKKCATDKSRKSRQKIYLRNSEDTWKKSKRRIIF